MPEPALANLIQKKHQDVGYSLDLKILRSFTSFEIFSYLVRGSESFSNCSNAKCFLLNAVFNNSEQMFVVTFRSSGGMLFDVVAFLGLIRFSSPSVSDKLASLNEKFGIFFNITLLVKH